MDWSGRIVSAASLLAVLAAWTLASGSGLVNATLFPPPSAVLAALVAVAASGELASHVISSMSRVFVGLAAGSAAGVAAGLVTGRVRLADESISPILNVLRSFPPVAIIPLIIVWLGIGDGAKVFSIAFAVFFPVWVNAHFGASHIPQHYLDAAATLTRSKTKKWTAVILPASVPHILAGVRVGVGVSFVMVFVSELAGSSSGIGYLIYAAHEAYRIDLMLAGLLVLGFLGSSTDNLVAYAGRRLFPWMGKTG